MRFFKAVLVVVLISLAVNQIIINLQSKPDFRLLLVQKENNQYHIAYALSSGSQSARMNVVYFPVLNAKATSSDVYLYYDGGGYATYSSWVPYNMIVTGLLYDLKYQAATRQQSRVSLIGPGDLMNFLLDSKPGTLIIPSFTSNIELKPLPVDENLLLTWVQGGGTLVLLGVHGKSIFRYPFLNLSHPVSNWTNVSYWTAADVPRTSPTQVSLSQDGGAIRIQHSDLSLVDRGFYGQFTPTSSLNISSRNMFLSFDLKVNGSQYLSNTVPLYVELKDLNGNSQAYWLPFNNPMEGEWIHFVVPLGQPDSSTPSGVDFAHVSIYFTAQVYPNKDPVGSSATFWVKNLSIEERQNIILDPIPLTEAFNQTLLSTALDLQYGYVNSGVSVSALSAHNGTVLGKTTEVGSDVRSSIGSLPYAAGRILIFGYGLYAPYQQLTVAKDIMQILESGILHSSGPASFRAYDLNAQSTLQDSIFVPVSASGWGIFAYCVDEFNGMPGKYMDISTP